MDPNHERLLRLVAEARKRLGLSKQATFIKATGLGKNTIRRFEQGEMVSDPTLRMISLTVGWTRDSAADVLQGGDPTLAVGAATSDVDGGIPDAWTELADRLPASFVHELATGKIFATDVQDLTLDGGLRLFTVVIRNPDQEPRSPAQVKAETEAWHRTQRELRQKPPVDTSADPTESGLE